MGRWHSPDAKGSRPEKKKTIPEKRKEQEKRKEINWFV
jgi:hypothetical protein